MGVQQGSILVPFLLLTYINDLNYASDMFSILMYADDTTLFCNFDNLCNENKIKSELNNIFNWLCSRRAKFGQIQGGCRGPSKIRQRGGCNNFLLFTR